MGDVFKTKMDPCALEDNIILGGRYRISVLTAGLIRLEYQEDGRFEDRPSQMVQNRDFLRAEYRMVKHEDGIEIITSRVRLQYNEGPWNWIRACFPSLDIR